MFVCRRRGLSGRLLAKFESSLVALVALVALVELVRATGCVLGLGQTSKATPSLVGGDGCRKQRSGLGLVINAAIRWSAAAAAAVTAVAADTGAVAVT